MLVSGLVSLCFTALALGNTVPPKQDPFYKPPSGYASLAPGDIIRHRPIPNPITGVFVSNVSLNVQAAYQILYRTTDSLGNATATVTTLIVPHNAQPDKLLSYQEAYDRTDENCSPSYVLQNETETNDSGDLFFITACLDQGWYVVTPDYEGEKAAFTAGVISGQATLDSIRAALKSSNFSQLDATAKYAMWGYSGGALASEWAAELVGSYAPDLLPNFLGVAIGGLTPNIINVLNTVNNGLFALLGPLGIEGLSMAYPDLKTYLNEDLVPATAAKFKSVLNCANMSDFAGDNIYSFFKDGMAFLNNTAVMSAVQAGGIMGLHGIPQIPLYVYKGVEDEISPVADTDALVAKYCSENVTLQYIRNVVAGHAVEDIVGSAGAFGWLQQRFAGVPAPKGCTTQNVAVSQVNNDTIVAFGQEIAAALGDLLDQPVGPTGLF